MKKAFRHFVMVQIAARRASGFLNHRLSRWFGKAYLLSDLCASSEAGGEVFQRSQDRITLPDRPDRITSKPFSNSV
jgi:hypothetical protein